MSDPLLTKNKILHIDDGSMGGGGPITHVNPLNYKEEDGDPNFIDDYFYNDALFDQDRQHIFHYCVFCHECFAAGSTQMCPILSLQHIKFLKN